MEASKVILIIDDDEDFQMILKISLHRSGYIVRSLFDGEIAATLSQSPAPDVILLDVDLPETNGAEICRQLKSNASTCDIPVIMVSANPYVDELSKQAGARDYVQKPFALQTLMEKVQASLLNT